MNKEITYLTLKLLNLCDMHCYMCGQVYEKNKHKEILPLSLIKEIVNTLPQLKTIYLFGGEPLIYPEMLPLLEFLKDRNIEILMTTNGRNLNDELIDAIIDSKLHDITFSIDSCNKDIYKKIRGLDSFDSVLSNINKLFKRKREKKSELPYIGLNCVILPENADSRYLSR